MSTCNGILYHMLTVWPLSGAVNRRVEMCGTPNRALTCIMSPLVTVMAFY
jgi:hypothetical protein